MKTTTKYNTGQTGEFLVAAELARRGFSVAMLTGNASAIDMLAYRAGTTLAVQVKSAAHGDHQFNIGKFLYIEHTDDGRQILHGPHHHLDASVVFALVRIADQSGRDEILWTTQDRFAGILEASHQAYLDKHGGRRPGKNPQSLHVSIKFETFIESGLCVGLDEFLALTFQPA